MASGIRLAEVVEELDDGLGRELDARAAAGRPADLGLDPEGRPDGLDHLLEHGIDRVRDDDRPGRAARVALRGIGTEEEGQIVVHLLGDVDVLL